MDNIKTSEVSQVLLNQLKQMDKLDDKAAVGNQDVEGSKNRTVEAVRNDIAVNTPPPPPAAAPTEVVTNKVFDVVEVMPSFPGGNGALMSYLSSNVKYPVDKIIFVPEMIIKALPVHSAFFTDFRNRDLIKPLGLHKLFKRHG